MQPDSMIGRYLHARERAVALGDSGLVRECDAKLTNLGYRPTATPAEVDVVEACAEAEASPRRGRPLTRRDA